MGSSQTRLTVLGVLAIEPASGYAIRQSIERTIGHFWHESFGQIYPTLASLEGDALIEVAEKDGRKTVYGITERGLDELQTLLSAPFSQTPPRNATLLRVFFGRFMRDERLRTLIEESEREARDQLEHLEQLRVQLEEEQAGDPDLEFWLLTLRSGQLGAEAKLAWAREARTRLAELPEVEA